MYTVTKYPHGTFSWADNSSGDTEAAKAFYVGLFGWDTVEVPIGAGMTYTVFQLDGHDCAALSGMMPDQLDAGVASHWNNFVTVDDVDALVPVINDNGGTVMFGPEDVFDSGRMLGLQDPSGAALNLWQPHDTIGAGIINTVGAMCWNELWTPDMAAAKRFYQAVLGWDFYHDPNHPANYAHISNRGRPNGGILELDWIDEPMWLPHFHVADSEAAVARVKALGGTIEIARQVDADGGSWAVVADPAGAQFYIMQPAKVDAWLE